LSGKVEVCDERKKSARASAREEVGERFSSPTASTRERHRTAKLDAASLVDQQFLIDCASGKPDLALFCLFFAANVVDLVGWKAGDSLLDFEGVVDLALTVE
jgi:hypothetical protein